MKFKKFLTLSMVFVLLAVLITGAASAAAVGGDQGTFRIRCDVDGAKVTFISINGDADEKGTIANGMLDVPVYLTATPYKQVRVEAEGYETQTVEITEYPPKDGVLDMTVNLERQAVGGDQGTFVIRSNAEGAKVTFISINNDEYDMGVIANGTLDVPVYLTATPFRQIRVEADGYETKTVEITEYPPKDGTLDIEINLLRELSTPGLTAIGTGLALLAAGVVLRRRNK